MSQGNLDERLELEEQLFEDISCMLRTALRHQLSDFGNWPSDAKLGFFQGLMKLMTRNELRRLGALIKKAQEESHEQEEETEESGD